MKIPFRAKYQEKLAIKAEQKRLENAFPNFEKEYWGLCKKYGAQWKPIIATSKTGEQTVFILRMQLQPFVPKIEVKKEGNGKAVEPVTPAQPNAQAN